MLKEAFERGQEQAKKDSGISYGTAAVGGLGLLGLGAFAGQKAYKSALTRMRDYGGRTGPILEKFFGTNKAKAKRFTSYYQGDTKYSHGGIFDHLAGEDITDSLNMHKGDLAHGTKHVTDSQHIRKNGEWSPAHNSHLIKNPDGTWSASFTDYYPPKPDARDQRGAFLSSIAEFDTKPSPEALNNLRAVKLHHYAKTKYM